MKMMNKLTDIIKKIQPLEIGLFILFFIYLLFDIKTPDVINPYLSSPIGIVFIILMTLFLFLYTNPIVGIMSLFVAYELIRRSSSPFMPSTTIMTTTPTEERRNFELKAMNKPKPDTLEEEVVSHMAPIGKSEQGNYIETSFKPISDDLLGGSTI